MVHLNIQIIFKQLLLHLTTLFVSSLIILPPSSFTLLKIILFSLICVNLIFLIFKDKYSFPHELLLIIFLCISFLFLSTIIGMLTLENDYTHTSRHLVSFLSFFVTFILLISVYNYLNSFTYFVRVCIYATTILAILKCLIIFGPYFELFSIQQQQIFVKSFVGDSVITFHSTEAIVFRVSFGNDILFPFAAMLLILSKNLNIYFSNKIQVIFWIFLSIAVVATFTRFIWIAFLLSVTFYFLLQKPKLILPVLILIIGYILFIIYFFEISYDSELYIRSYDSASIDMKSSQFYALIDGSAKTFVTLLFGHGAGTYLHDFIRSSYLPYTYEVQWAALIYQFGFIGIIFFGIFFMYVLRFKVLNTHYTYLKVYLILMYAIWLSAGLFNPYLFIWTSVIVYVIFYFLSEQINKLTYRAEEQNTLKKLSIEKEIPKWRQ